MGLTILNKEEIEELKNYLKDKANPKYKGFAEDLLEIITYRLGLTKPYFRQQPENSIPLDM